MKTPRAHHCALAMDNSFYVCGGFDSDKNVLSSVEQFIVNDSRGWIKQPEMNQKRFSFISTFFSFLIPIFCLLFNFIGLYNSNQIIKHFSYVKLSFIYRAKAACYVLNNIAYGFLNLASPFNLLILHKLI